MTMVIERMAQALNRHDLNAFLGASIRTIAANNPPTPTGASVAKNRSARTGRACSKASRTSRHSCFGTRLPTV